ncbi:hypothetical protein [Spirosoma fluviale]|uniref:Uracil DNA glycosylase superfamily protein n=1 Tax=Spirosoma fluviale TaxID=1597977 RepID=A0A286FY88_9BACT|nr:hypothetical protein [Spirosoma fluviale]SOD88235.1 hypothetical protein SAMN06269250_2566 [Spirosoma fluviale]
MDLFFQELEILYKKSTSLADYNNGIIRDGIIDPIRFNKQTTKILFIAKEHNRLNDTYESGEYAEWWNGVDSVRYGFSHRISEWAYGILHNFPTYESITYVDKNEALQSIAFINLKKTWGSASADPIVLSNYVALSKTLLQQQIQAISPTIILSCLRYDYLPKQLFDFANMKTTPHGFQYGVWDNKLVINFYHPSARKNKSVLYSQLKEVVSFALSDSHALLHSRY